MYYELASRESTLRYLKLVSASQTKWALEPNDQLFSHLWKDSCVTGAGALMLELEMLSSERWNVLFWKIVSVYVCLHAQMHKLQSSQNEDPIIFKNADDFLALFVFTCHSHLSVPRLLLHFSCRCTKS